MAKQIFAVRETALYFIPRWLKGEHIARKELARHLQHQFKFDEDHADASSYAAVKRAKDELWREGEIVIVNLGEGVYGIPKTKEEYAFAQRTYYTKVKSMMTGALRVYQYGQGHNLLPDGMKQERLMLPKVTL